MTSYKEYALFEEQTNKGLVRKANEDHLTHFECQNGFVAIVCDGMGGHVGGAVASHTAIEAMQDFLCNNYFEDARKAIREAINVGNKAVLQRGEEDPSLKGMGSTCVMLIIRNGLVYIGSVGDSRIYLVSRKDGEPAIRQITKDQSFVQMLVDLGEITPEEAETHPRKNQITNAIGIENMRPATVLAKPFIPDAGDCFLLCSDGLSGMMNDQDILNIVSNGTSLGERVEALIQLALQNGGRDNVTCQLLEFTQRPDVDKSDPIFAIVQKEETEKKDKVAQKSGMRSAVDTSEVNTMVDYPGTRPESTEKKGRKSKMMLILPVAIIVAALGTAACFFFLNDNENADSSKSGNDTTTAISEKKNDPKGKEGGKPSMKPGKGKGQDGEKEEEGSAADGKTSEEIIEEELTNGAGAAINNGTEASNGILSAVENAVNNAEQTINDNAK